jgi:ERCC4-type nuclease
MKLCVDCRESNAINTLTDKLEYDVLQLSIGDFQIKSNDLNKTHIIFERKTLPDLISSIKDGRYKEQSMRLNAHELDNHKIYYIIEGNIAKNINKDLIYSTLFSLSYVKGFSVMQTMNITETCNIIVKFFERLKKEDINKPVTIPEYSSTIKCCKQNNITTDNIGEIMLMQVPGISNITAKAILLEFDSFYDMLHQIRIDPLCLHNIRIHGKTTRKIGKNVVNNIIKFLI